jgi:hypothetical protein
MCNRVPFPFERILTSVERDAVANFINDTDDAIKGANLAAGHTQ